jgi:uncharacterized protein YndB with AHSA1/START domain
MIEHAVEVRINRPPAAVFAFVTDAANHPRWDTSSVSMTPDQPGPWAAGMTFHEVRKMGPRQMEIQSKVAALVPGESMEIESLTGPEFHGHWRFIPDGDGTVLRWSCEMAVSGAGRPFQPLIARSFRTACDQNFARLKQLFES